jgi:hypothetical protein
VINNVVFFQALKKNRPDVCNILLPSTCDTVKQGRRSLRGLDSFYFRQIESIRGILSQIISRVIFIAQPFAQCLRYFCAMTVTEIGDRDNAHIKLLYFLGILFPAAGGDKKETIL